MIDGEVVAIDLESGRYYSLEGAAARAWEALGDGQDVDGIAAVVADEAGLSADDVRADVAAFLAELDAEGLLLDGNGAASPNRAPVGSPSHSTATRTCRI